MVELIAGGWTSRGLAGRHREKQGGSRLLIPRKRRESNNSGTSIPISRFRCFVLKSILDVGLTSHYGRYWHRTEEALLHDPKESKKTEQCAAWLCSSPKRFDGTEISCISRFDKVRDCFLFNYPNIYECFKTKLTSLKMIIKIIIKIITIKINTPNKKPDRRYTMA